MSIFDARKKMVRGVAEEAPTIKKGAPGEKKPKYGSACAIPGDIPQPVTIYFASVDGQAPFAVLPSELKEASERSDTIVTKLVPFMVRAAVSHNTFNWAEARADKKNLDAFVKAGTAVIHHTGVPQRTYVKTASGFPLVNGCNFKKGADFEAYHALAGNVPATECFISAERLNAWDKLDLPARERLVGAEGCAFLHAWHTAVGAMFDSCERILRPEGVASDK